MGKGIHPTVVVEQGAQIAEDVEIGPYSVIGPNVSIGAGSKLGPHVVIEGYTSIGEGNIISQFASIGGAPQDLKYQGEPSTLKIGNRNIIREYVTIHPGTRTGTMTTIVGDQNLFMASSHVGHDSRIGNRCIFANSVALAGHVQIENAVILGGLVGVHQFTRIGELAMASAGSKIGADVPPYCFAQGDRARLRGVNVVGLKRAGYTSQQVMAVRKVYKILFGNIGDPRKKIDQLPEELRADTVVSKLLDFILSDEGRGMSIPARKLEKEA